MHSILWGTIRHLKTRHERVGIIEIHPILVPYDIGLDVTLPSCELKSINPPVSKKPLMSFQTIKH